MRRETLAYSLFLNLSSLSPHESSLNLNLFSLSLSHHTPVVASTGACCRVPGKPCTSLIPGNAINSLSLSRSSFSFSFPLFLEESSFFFYLFCFNHFFSFSFVVGREEEVEGKKERKVWANKKQKTKQKNGK